MISSRRSASAPEVRLICTGCHADERHIEHADLVTEMREVKHPYKSGIRAQAGIEFLRLV